MLILLLILCLIIFGLPIADFVYIGGLTFFLRVLHCLDTQCKYIIELEDIHQYTCNGRLTVLIIYLYQRANKLTCAPYWSTLHFQFFPHPFHINYYIPTHPHTMATTTP